MPHQPRKVIGVLRKVKLRLITPAGFAGAAEIKTQYVEVFEQRPQVVDSWAMPPVVVPEDQQVIVYGVDGRKSIVKGGRLPKRLEANLSKERKN